MPTTCPYEGNQSLNSKCSFILIISTNLNAGILQVYKGRCLRFFDGSACFASSGAYLKKYLDLLSLTCFSGPKRGPSCRLSNSLLQNRCACLGRAGRGSCWCLMFKRCFFGCFLFVFFRIYDTMFFLLPVCNLGFKIVFHWYVLSVCLVVFGYFVCSVCVWMVVVYAWNCLQQHVVFSSHVVCEIVAKAKSGRESFWASYDAQVGPGTEKVWVFFVEKFFGYVNCLRL